MQINNKLFFGAKTLAIFATKELAGIEENYTYTVFSVLSGDNI